jgi:hypothetical protein
MLFVNSVLAGTLAYKQQNGGKLWLTLAKIL